MQPTPASLTLVVHRPPRFRGEWRGERKAIDMEKINRRKRKTTNNRSTAPRQDLYQEITNKIIAQMEQGKLPRLTTYLQSFDLSEFNSLVAPTGASYSSWLTFGRRK